MNCIVLLEKFETQTWNSLYRLLSPSLISNEIRLYNLSQDNKEDINAQIEDLLALDEHINILFVDTLRERDYANTKFVDEFRYMHKTKEVEKNFHFLNSFNITKTFLFIDQFTFSDDKYINEKKHLAYTLDKCGFLLGNGSEIDFYSNDITTLDTAIINFKDDINHWDWSNLDEDNIKTIQQVKTTIIQDLKNLFEKRYNNSSEDILKQFPSRKKDTTTAVDPCDFILSIKDLKQIENSMLNTIDSWENTNIINLQPSQVLIDLLKRYNTLIGQNKFNIIEYRYSQNKEVPLIMHLQSLFLLWCKSNAMRDSLKGWHIIDSLELDDKQICKSAAQLNSRMNELKKQLDHSKYEEHSIELYEYNQIQVNYEEATLKEPYELVVPSFLSQKNLANEQIKAQVNDLQNNTSNLKDKMIQNYDADTIQIVPTKKHFTFKYKDLQKELENHKESTSKVRTSFFDSFTNISNDLNDLNLKEFSKIQKSALLRIPTIFSFIFSYFIMLAFLLTPYLIFLTTIDRNELSLVNTVYPVLSSILLLIIMKINLSKSQHILKDLYNDNYNFLLSIYNRQKQLQTDIKKDFQQRFLYKYKQENIELISQAIENYNSSLIQEKYHINHINSTTKTLLQLVTNDCLESSENKKLLTIDQNKMYYDSEGYGIYTDTISTDIFIDNKKIEIKDTASFVKQMKFIPQNNNCQQYNGLTHE